MQKTPRGKGLGPCLCQRNPLDPGLSVRLMHILTRCGLAVRGPVHDLCLSAQFRDGFCHHRDSRMIDVGEESHALLIAYALGLKLA
jgi:hypothetical protein